MDNILIVGGGLQAISCARSLREVGYNIGIWCSKGNIATKSSAISFFKYQQDLNDYNEFIDFVKKNAVSVIIPMSDHYALILSTLKERLWQDSNVYVATPDQKVLKIAGDKQRLMSLCEEYNIPHPYTISADEYKSKSSNLSFPLLIKPNHSVGARGITLVRSFTELEHRLPIIENEFGNCHLQEYISGNRPYYNVMLYRDKTGKIIQSVVLEIIRFYPLKGGSSSMCRTIDSKDIVNICRKVLDILNYNGFADFDVLQSETGEYKIIEINPRVPASLRGAAISGVNFPAIIVADTLGKEIPQYSYQPGKTLRYLGLDIMWFLSSPNRFKSSPSWFKFFGKDIYYQEGGKKDLKPMLYSLFSNLNKLTISNGKIKKKSSL